MNAYESGSQKIIPAVLLYAFYGDSVLMIQAKKLNGIWNGLGGKLEKGESPLDAAIREFKEEAFCDTTASQWKNLGQLYFPNFKPNKSQDWWVSVFRTELNDVQFKQIPTQNPDHPDGELRFFTKQQLLELPLYEGDKIFLPFVLNGTPFNGTLFYDRNGVTRASVSPY